MTATDPAPPLFLPSHKEVTEDAVATALGYAAQVVQLLSAYMGMRLVYPVTCVGSKSLIKDGISAMVGPRMFPLFSKGVDTYRFEYGVFLLNKDIELLMTDRNLRALDMRHTLPNLKNLLLTLTDSENIRPPPTHHVASSSASISSLRSPVLTQTPLPSETSTIQANSLPEIAVDATAAENGSPSASGSSTPTATAGSNTLSRKSRTFLDLAPLAGFLRSRYPSSAKPPAKGPVGIPETPPESASAGASTANASGDAADGDSHAADDAAGSGDDEDDRRTIRADDVADEDDDDDEVVQEDKIVTNGNGHTAPNLAEERAGGHEKVVEDGVPLSPTVLLSS
ncbi:hypothetical protein A0H81_00302 [Grifola frondosa]|uniref:Uncharacterized protein n=1 Tax=Grifola frondosa TaxID=5627 RepID=A0A1C7MQ28_GRIFR|nr:hypothetical protein A0H81_00302 [Grifola frondosa]